MTDHQWQPGEIFVFGSNRAGIHGAGAARTARLEHGAASGVGEGRTGQSYALPTVDSHLHPLSLDQIQGHATRFLRHASMSPHLTFFLTRVGCGLAGFPDAQIAPLFRGAPDNVRMPPGWRELAATS